jgi:DNA-binding transcriptional ArsR family regulator
MYICAYIMQSNTNKDVLFFKALGDASRLRIVRCLLHRNYCACNFNDMTGKDQTTVSRHLRILVEGGILVYEKKGRNIMYQIKDASVKKRLLHCGIQPLKKCC